MADRPEPADVVWIGLSLHHLQPADKLVIMREARGALEGKGQLMIYEPTRRERESRDGYLERFTTINQPIWSALTDAEWATILDHVTHCDFPETASGWLGLGSEAGFLQQSELFVAPTDLYRLFRFQG